jgi:hypothetical protein
MSDRIASVEAALDQMVAAARAHLAAVMAADGAPDDEVWSAYVALNNAAHDYDEILNDVYGEVTPWDLEPITEDGEPLASTLVSLPTRADADDPHPRVISVRQRRDYRVPSVTALLAVAEAGRPAPLEGEPTEPLSTVGEAIIELLESGDGSLGMLDLPELEPLDGVIVVAEVDAPLSPDVLETIDESESDQPFRLAPGERVAGRVHESALPGLDE